MNKHLAEKTLIAEVLATAGEKNIGCITLNSPATLNALTLDMAQAILAALKNWQHDTEIACIVITSSGDKAFCSGGDIQALYHSAISSSRDNTAETFFTCEYKMNYTLHTYPKPIVVLGQGIIMGGGLGIFMGCSHRIVCDSTYAAMPEVKIALFPDVGGTYFLNRMPDNCGLFIALTAAPLNASDCLYLDLANYYMHTGELDGILSLLRNLNWSDNEKENSEKLNDALSPFYKSHQVYIDKSHVYQNLPAIKSAFSDGNLATIHKNIMAMDSSVKWLKKSMSNFEYGSAISKRVIFNQLRLGKDFSLKQVFQSELSLATNITKHPEFAEGVRALLIDKDLLPAWEYQHIEDVPDELIKAFFTPPWETNPLAQL